MFPVSYCFSDLTSLVDDLVMQLPLQQEYKIPVGWNLAFIPGYETLRLWTICCNSLSFVLLCFYDLLNFV